MMSRRRVNIAGEIIGAGSTALQLTRVIADALPVGPILVGSAKPAHVLTPSVTARGIVNMTAIAAAEAAQPCQLSRGSAAGAGASDRRIGTM